MVPLECVVAAYGLAPVCPLCSPVMADVCVLRMPQVYARPGDNREYLRKTMCVGGSAQAIEICLTARETLFGGLG